MYQHPAVLEALMRDRVAELRRSGPAPARIGREKRRHRGVAAARYGVGWLLVDMGLRLVTPRGGTSYPVAGGRR